MASWSALGSNLPTVGARSPRLVLTSGSGCIDFVNRIAAELGVATAPVTVRDFANGEIYVRFDESVRGADVFLVQTVGEDINRCIVELLVMVDALRRASAAQITVVLPYFPYSRQDKKHRGREPISARMLADVLTAVGVDRLSVLDLHADQIQGFFNGPVDHLSAQSVLAEYVARRYGDRPITVVSPDTGRVKSAERWAGELGDAPLAFIHKTRDTRVPNLVRAHRVVGDVRDRLCVVVDDMIDTAGTIRGAVDLLLAAGSGDVVVAATHGLLSGDARSRLVGSGVREVVITDSVEVPEERRFPELTVVSVVPLLARAVREIFVSGSVTSLFA